ncbi:hypothetical protein V1512DRAFT_201457 [Lipomyces arxii]|uniref:uncharacterized protein n=1 Tax=Lipomyces arxii TaxID=56418 RepID=UPI0034CE9223
MDSSKQERSPDSHSSRHRHHHDSDRRDRDSNRYNDSRRDRDRGRDSDRHRERDRSGSPGARRSRRDAPEDENYDERSSARKNDAIAAAAAAAERINAQIQAKFAGGPLPTSPAPSSFTPTSLPPSRATEHSSGEADDFVQDIEINHLMNRYTLTKGQTQTMIKTESGADVTTRGRYYPDKSMATEADPPLYLHVTSLTQEGLDKAVKIIEDLMAQDNKPPPPRQSDPGQSNGPPTGPAGAVGQYNGGNGERPPFQREFRRRWVDDRVPIGLDYLAGFNVRGQIVGSMGANVKHIQNETGCRVQIKGRGSQFIEQATGQEGEEPMYLHIMYFFLAFRGQDPVGVARAADLAKDLVKSVTDSYNAFKANPRSQQRYNGGGGGGYGNNYGGGGRNGGGGYGRNQYQQSPPPESGSVSPTGASNQPDYTAYYAAVAAGQDPYAAYGGYEAYVQYYQQYYAQYYAQQQQQQQQNGGEAGGQQPPQPPSSGAGSYNSVPPPAGL